MEHALGMIECSSLSRGGLAPIPGFQALPLGIPVEPLAGIEGGIDVIEMLELR